MFKFQTTTILNGATADRLTLANYTTENGVAVSKNDDPALDWTSADYGNAKIVCKENEWLQIERLGKFVKGNVTKVFRRNAEPGTAGKVEITVALDNTINSYKLNGAGENKGIYRLVLYIRLGQGSMNSNFSNVRLFKGKPLAFEVEVGANDTAANLASKLEAAIKYETTRFGSKNVKVKAEGAKLTIEAVGPDKCYQWFETAKLQKFDVNVGSALRGGEYVTYMDLESTVTTGEGDQATTSNSINNTMCEYPFGTYGQLIKDLRLPTPEHTGWSVIQKDEMPVLGTNYAQFMIYMCVNRGIMGGDAVGEPTKSITAHSIWVPQAAADAFQTLLESTVIDAVEEFDAEYKEALGDNVNSVADDTANNITIEPDLQVTE